MCLVNAHSFLPENDNYSPIDGTNAEIIGIVKAVVREY